MSFWSDNDTTAVLPKRQFRWVMNMGGVPQWIVKKVNKPAFSVSEGKHVYLNHTFYYPGRVEYEKISVTLVDPAAPDATAIMWDILKKSGYRLPTSQTDLYTLNKQDGSTALGNVQITQIDGIGKVQERISLKNPWIAGVKFGELDYESDNLLDLTLEIRYDFVSIDAITDDTWKSAATVGALTSETTTGVNVTSEGDPLKDVRGE
ncbi:hypothetical protein CMI37_11015 [Candidatus Pacearchaeota archaeon]|nr:hypothetical protein [Candidatus Pacearchaeota archaeon]